VLTVAPGLFIDQEASMHQSLTPSALDELVRELDILIRARYPLIVRRITK